MPNMQLIPSTKKQVWIRDNDPRHFNSLEECEAAAPYEGPGNWSSLFEVVETSEGRRYFGWGFISSMCAAQAGLKASQRIDVPMPKTYAEWRALKAAAK